MTGFRAFTVLPRVPEALSFLQTLANNVWWCWNVDATALFDRIDPVLFRKLQRNPSRLLGVVKQERLRILSL